MGRSPSNRLSAALDCKLGKVGLTSFKDINGDGILQFYEFTLGPDAVVLVTPAIAGLPSVFDSCIHVRSNVVT